MKIKKYDSQGFLKFGSLKGILTESSKTRLWNQLLNPNTLGIISACTTLENGKPSPDNAEKMAELKREVRDTRGTDEHNLGFKEVVSRWVDPETNEVTDERALIIPDISYETAMMLGAKYNQKTIIFKDSTGCKEICTTPYEYEEEVFDDNGDVVDTVIVRVKPEDVVRTFNTSDPQKILNIDTAKDIFASKLTGAVSRTTKGDIYFHLDDELEESIKNSLEIYEMPTPKPSAYRGSYYGPQRIL